MNFLQFMVLSEGTCVEHNSSKRKAKVIRKREMTKVIDIRYVDDGKEHIGVPFRDFTPLPPEGTVPRNAF